MNSADLVVLEKRVHAITRPENALLWLYVISSFALLCAGPIALIPLYFRFHTLWYRFDATGVSMGYGILFRREMQLTYARMQDIHLSQNILERWLGIGTVTVQTAGSGASGNLSIVGVREFDAIRDYLYAKMRGIRDVPPEAHAQHDTADQLLVEIRDALKDTTTALSAKREP